jgi:hypothetical protein
MAGAGPLVSSIWKHGDCESGWAYRFNIYRMTPRSGHVVQLFRPEDILHLSNLCRVLAAIVADDGCIPAALRSELASLIEKLDGDIGRED